MCTALCGATADSFLSREVSFIQSVLYREVPLYSFMDIESLQAQVRHVCRVEWGGVRDE